jgi:pimeloyl-ACP methyl ester carboxylesterase
MLYSEENSLSLSGKQIHVKKMIPEGNVWNPDEPVLILLHEGLGSITQWKDFPERLAEKCGYQVLLYDRPGYGSSEEVTTPRKLDYLHHEAAFLNDLVRYFSLKHYFLLGHSEGGSITLIHAAGNPEGLHKVITLAANTRYEDKMLPAITEVVKTYEQTGSKLKQALEKHHGRKTDTVFYAWSKVWTAPFFSVWNIRKELKQIRVPVMAIHGDNDQYSSSLQTDLIKENIPSAEIVSIKKCSHHPHVDHPDAVTALICDFLKKA